MITGHRNFAMVKKKQTQKNPPKQYRTLSIFQEHNNIQH